MEGTRPSEPRDAASAPVEGTLGAVSVHRCPHCHADVALGKEPLAVCATCLAPHHAACWGEGGGRCGACRGETSLVAAGAEGPAPARRRGRGRWLAFALLFALGYGGSALVRSTGGLRTTAEIQRHLIEDDLKSLRERYMFDERAAVLARVEQRIAALIQPDDPRYLLLQEARLALGAAHAAHGRMGTTEANEELARAERRLREVLQTLD